MEHTEEVWHVQFSHNGRWLASASRDASAVVWEVTPQRLLVKRHVLRGHTGSLTFCCWSPDDGILATCSADCMVTYCSGTNKRQVECPLCRALLVRLLCDQYEDVAL